MSSSNMDDMDAGIYTVLIVRDDARMATRRPVFQTPSTTFTSQSRGDLTAGWVSQPSQEARCCHVLCSIERSR